MSGSAQQSQKGLMVNVFSSLLTMFLKISLLVWVNQYLIKRVDPEEYSLLPLVMSLLIFADIFRNMFVDGLGRFMVEADAKKDSSKIQEVVSSMWPILLGMAALFAVIGGTAVWFVDYLLAIEAEFIEQARLMLGILVFSFCLDVILAPFTVGLYVKQKFTRINALTLVVEIVRISIVLSLLFGFGPRVVWLVVASLVAQLITLGVKCFYTRKLLPNAVFKPSLFSPEVAKKVTSFGAWSSIGNLSQFAINTVPFLLLGHFAGAIQVSIFHLGRLPEVNIRKLAIAAVTPVQPLLTSKFATDGESSINEFYYRGGRYHLWATLLLVAPAITFADTVAVLYAGETYVSAGITMLILLSSYPIIWASAMFYRISHATGEVSSYYKCEIIDVIAKILLVVLFVVAFDFGAIGAAIGITSATVLIHFFKIWPQGLKMVSGKWNIFFKEGVIPGCLPFIGALLFCVLIRMTLTPTSWLSLGISAAGAVSLYALILLVFCTDEFDKDVVRKITGKFKRILNKNKYQGGVTHRSST